MTELYAVLVLQALIVLGMCGIAWRQWQISRTQASIQAWMDHHSKYHRKVEDYLREHVRLHGMMGRGHTWPGSI